jgi:hypothetical protein
MTEAWWLGSRTVHSSLASLTFASPVAILVRNTRPVVGSFASDIPGTSRVKCGL